MEERWSFLIHGILFRRLLTTTIIILTGLFGNDFGSCYIVGPDRGLSSNGTENRHKAAALQNHDGREFID